MVKGSPDPSNYVCNKLSILSFLSLAVSPFIHRTGLYELVARATVSSEHHFSMETEFFDNPRD